MKKIVKLIIIILIIAVVAFFFMKMKTKKNENEEEYYSIKIMNEKYDIDPIACKGLKESQVQEIVNEIFCANHNIARIFYSTTDLTNKDFQMAVWFKKYIIEDKKTCSKEEFEQTVKDIYNIDFTEHGELENTFSYSNGTYSFKNIDYEKYQVPIIENIKKIDENTYEACFALTNKNINYIHEIKYRATLKIENENLYIKSITEYIL